MTVVSIYDPPMCCSTGVCGPEVDPKLARSAGAARLRWHSLPEQGPLARSWASILRSPCLRWPFVDRARLRTYWSPSDNWTHRPVISGMAFSTRRSLALA